MTQRSKQRACGDVARGQAGRRIASSLALARTSGEDTSAKAGAHIPVRRRRRPVASPRTSDRAECGILTCAVKRALPKFKVAADWRAPVERNRWEVDWMRVAGDVVPDAVPAILGEDRRRGRLRDGLACRRRTTRCGSSSSRAAPSRPGDRPCGSATCSAACTPPPPTGRTSRRGFATDAIFHAIRLGAVPGGDRAGARRPAPHGADGALAERRGSTRRVPGARRLLAEKSAGRAAGPASVLDAECAWFGDPAFDLRVRAQPTSLLQGAWRAGVEAALRRGVPRAVNAALPVRARRVGAVAGAWTPGWPRCCRG